MYKNVEYLVIDDSGVVWLWRDTPGFCLSNKTKPHLFKLPGTNEPLVGYTAPWGVNKNYRASDYCIGESEVYGSVVIGQMGANGEFVGLTQGQISRIIDAWDLLYDADSDVYYFE